MGMNGTYYKAHIENMKLRKNKARFKRLKDNAFEKFDNKMSLKFATPSDIELKEIRKQIFIDIRREQKRRRLITYFAFFCGLIVAVWVIYALQYKLI